MHSVLYTFSISLYCRRFMRWLLSSYNAYAIFNKNKKRVSKRDSGTKVGLRRTGKKWHFLYWKIKIKLNYGLHFNYNVTQKSQSVLDREIIACRSSNRKMVKTITDYRKFRNKIIILTMINSRNHSRISSALKSVFLWKRTKKNLMINNYPRVYLKNLPSWLSLKQNAELIHTIGSLKFSVFCL